MTANSTWSIQYFASLIIMPLRFIKRELIYASDNDERCCNFGQGKVPI